MQPNILRFTALFLALILNLHCLSQTAWRSNLVSDFFKHIGSDVMTAFTHPTCDKYLTIVEAYNESTYYVRIYYKYGWGGTKTFKCDYEIKIGSSGLLYEVDSYSCGSPTATCFSACNFAKDLASRISSSEKDRYERFLSKALKQFSCEDFCHARLFYKWYDLGYYKAY